MPHTPGWRRLWPSKNWLQIFEEGGAGSGVWNWRIWDERKIQTLACGAESYKRDRDAARGGLRFAKSAKFDG
jgi:hypothetical protein